MLSFLVYMQLGMHTSVNGQQAQQQAQAQPQQQQAIASVEEMTRTLAARLQKQGGNQEEWTMLGRAYKHIGQYVLAAEAFAQAVEINPTAQLMLEQSEALALGNNQSFTAQGRDLVMRALEMEPDNVNVLWFAGVAEFQAGNYRSSIDHLSRLSAQAQQDPEINRSLRLYIDRARNQLIAAGEAVPTTDEILGTSATAKKVADTGAVSQTADSGARVRVTIDINDEVRSRFSSGDTVFVYAKAAAGPKMPLAVQRLTLAQLPTTVTLDDSMAMMEGMNMSAFGSVIVSARVTTSGSAIANAGDYIGEFKVDDVSQTELVEVQINTLVE
jgi:cytochrome c-type biogenesis protein CcmH